MHKVTLDSVTYDCSLSRVLHDYLLSHHALPDSLPDYATSKLKKSMSAAAATAMAEASRSNLAAGGHNHRVGPSLAASNKPIIVDPQSSITDELWAEMAMTYASLLHARASDDPAVSQSSGAEALFSAHFRR